MIHFDKSVDTNIKKFFSNKIFNLFWIDDTLFTTLKKILNI